MRRTLTAVSALAVGLGTVIATAAPAGAATIYGPSGYTVTVPDMAPYPNGCADYAVTVAGPRVHSIDTDIYDSTGSHVTWSFIFTRDPDVVTSLTDPEVQVCEFDLDGMTPPYRIQVTVTPDYLASDITFSGTWNFAPAPAPTPTPSYSPYTPAPVPTYTSPPAPVPTYTPTPTATATPAPQPATRLNAWSPRPGVLKVVAAGPSPNGVVRVSRSGRTVRSGVAGGGTLTFRNLPRGTYTLSFASQTMRVYVKGRP